MYIHTTVVCVLCMMYNNHTTRKHLHYPQGGDGGDGGDSSKSILAEELRSFGGVFPRFKLQMVSIWGQSR